MKDRNREKSNNEWLRPLIARKSNSNSHVLHQKLRNKTCVCASPSTWLSHSCALLEIHDFHFLWGNQNGSVKEMNKALENSFRVGGNPSDCREFSSTMSGTVTWRHSRALGALKATIIACSFCQMLSFITSQLFYELIENVLLLFCTGYGLLQVYSNTAQQEAETFIAEQLCGDREWM